METVEVICKNCGRDIFVLKEYLREKMFCTSSGSGGQGVVTKEPQNNTDKYQTIVEYIVANMSTLYSFTIPEFSIYQIIATGPEDEIDVAIRVELLKEVSKLTGSSPGDCKNQNVWLGSSLIKDLIVRFKVENSKINGDVQLLGWSGNKWIPLEIKEINKDDTYTYFETEITGSAILSICTGKIEVISTPIIPYGSTTVPEETIAAPTPTEAPGFEILASIATLLVIYIFRRR